MTTDGSGVPLQVKIYPGNINQPKTLGNAVVGLSVLKPLVMMDTGISTKDKLVVLKKQRLGWITVARGNLVR